MHTKSSNVPRSLNSNLILDLPYLFVYASSKGYGQTARLLLLVLTKAEVPKTSIAAQLLGYNAQLCPSKRRHLSSADNLCKRFGPRSGPT